MMTPVPQLLMKSKGEVLPVNGGSAKEDTPKAAKTRAPAEGEKVTIRRLPPGMTAAEFEAILGDEWLVGKGKVSWYEYCVGKVARE
jgi:regulator of nonsense transcripts 3